MANQEFDGEVVFYQPDDNINLEVRLSEETVWLSQQQMAELFGTQRQAITKHLKNIFDTDELDRKSTSSILELVRKEGSRMVKRSVELFNLDVIVSVGFRVNTKKGILFRQWANKVLKQYLLNGYAINQQLKAFQRQIDNRFDLQEEKIHNIEKRLNAHDEFYHFGASLKDLGKKVCAVMKMEESKETILGIIEN